jgi:hypothetical protein
MCSTPQFAHWVYVFPVGRKLNIVDFPTWPHPIYFCDRALFSVLWRMIWSFVCSLAYLQTPRAGHCDMWSWLLLWAFGPSVFACEPSCYDMCTACEAFIEAQFAFQMFMTVTQKLTAKLNSNAKSLIMNLESCSVNSNTFSRIWK